MTRKKIKKLLKEITGKEAKVEYPADPRNGDYSTNVAMTAKLEPNKIAAKLKDEPMFKKVKVVKPGFINFYLSKEYLQKQVNKIKIPNIGKGKKVQVEFISANPTGPLHIGNGRGAFFGDALANVLEKAGFKVEREYYINDRGKQVENLKKGLYKGETRTAKQIQKANQKFITQKLKIKFDVWFSEQSLYDSKQTEKVLKLLDKKGLTYKKEGALWFKTSKFGDDKDRVLIKKDEESTYLLSDIAYFKNKMNRGCKLVINLWGADHHGYVPRFKAMIRALGYGQQTWQPLLFQMVRLTKTGKEFRMSKRKGAFVTLEWLIDEVGLDAARFFFLNRGPGSHLNFDLDLAKEQSEKNPVYYVQYAHARICSILRKLKNQNLKLKNQNLKLLKHPSELKLIKELIKFPEVVEDVAADYQVQRLPQYAMDLATAFHQFYRDCRVLTADKKITEARLALVLATKTILKNTFDLMGIKAPKRM